MTNRIKYIVMMALELVCLVGCNSIKEANDKLNDATINKIDEVKNIVEDVVGKERPNATPTQGPRPSDSYIIKVEATPTPVVIQQPEVEETTDVSSIKDVGSMTDAQKEALISKIMNFSISDYSNAPYEVESRLWIEGRTTADRETQENYQRVSGGKAYTESDVYTTTHGVTSGSGVKAYTEFEDGRYITYMLEDRSMYSENWFVTEGCVVF